MYLFRPLAPDDYAAVGPMLAALGGHGTGTLPLHYANGGAGAGDTTGGAIFVAEEAATGRLAGVALVRLPQDLQHRPIVSWQQGRRAHARFDGDAYQWKDTLTLSYELSGWVVVELAFANASVEAGAAAALCEGCLALARSGHFPHDVALRLPGEHRPDGTSAFWDGLGARFLNRDRGTGGSAPPSRSWGLGDLMPRSPLYVELLDDDARAVVGRIDPRLSDLQQHLLAQGWERSQHVDLVDGGPFLVLRRNTPAPSSR